MHNQAMVCTPCSHTSTTISTNQQRSSAWPETATVAAHVLDLGWCSRGAQGCYGPVTWST